MSEEREWEVNRESVRTSVLRGIARRRVMRQRRVIGIIAGGAVLLAGGVGLGAARLSTLTPADVANVAVCYSSADSTTPHYFGNGDEEPYDVAELCAEMWKRGVIGQTPRPVDPNDMTADFPVPEIAVCLDRDGYRAGFPIWDGETPRQLCDRLGLPLVEAGS